jgi:hypothetical protein
MFSGLLGKLVLTALVVFLVWRGLQLWQGMQKRLAKAEAERDRESRAPQVARPRPLPRCAAPTSRAAAPAPAASHAATSKA